MEGTGIQLNPLEFTMYILGLNTPVSRFLAGFSATSSILWALKPQFAFDRKGAPLSWDPSGSDRKCTRIPWFVPGLLTGTAMALFL